MKKILSVMISVMFISVFSICTVSAVQADISAKGFVLIEEKTGEIIYEKDPFEKLPMASTTKIMTALLCLESGGLDDEFVVDPEAIKVEGSSMGLREGDIVTKRALCCGMLLPSGNDAANAAAVRISGSIPEFVKLMNKKAEEIGLTRTHFVTPSGLEGEGHGSSAYDMALLAREALKEPEFCNICSQSSMKVRFGSPPYDRWLKNTNKLLTMYDGVKGVKTGFTDEAGRCLVSACERDGVTLICVTLNDRNDWNDHMKMYDEGFSAVRTKKLSCKESFEVPVMGGQKDKVAVSAQKDVVIGSDGKNDKNIHSDILLPPFVYPDIKCGDKIGELRWYCGERLIESVDINALEDVGYKSNDNEDISLWEKIKKAVFN